MKHSVCVLICIGLCLAFFAGGALYRDSQDDEEMHRLIKQQAQDIYASTFRLPDGSHTHSSIERPKWFKEGDPSHKTCFIMQSDTFACFDDKYAQFYSYVPNPYKTIVW